MSGGDGYPWRTPLATTTGSLGLPERRRVNEHDLVRAVMDVDDVLRQWGVYMSDRKASKPSDVRWMLAPFVGRLLELERQVERQGRDQETLAKLIAPDLERVCEPMAEPAPAAVISGQPVAPPAPRPRWHRPGKR